MYRTPKNVKPKKGLNIAYVFLREDEILKEDDLVRSTQYPNTYSDDINYEYLNAMNWEYVKDKMPGWKEEQLKIIETLVISGVVLM